MKIATRIALLHWQANPADPTNLWRLIIAWIVPGTREPGREKNARPGTTSKEASRVHNRRVAFVAGGIVLAVLAWAVGHLLWNRAPARSAEDDTIYDGCLVHYQGNRVVCDAMMRQLERARAAEVDMKQQAARLLAAGYSKREVVKWAFDHGFVGKQVSDAVGISLEDLQAGKY